MRSFIQTVTRCFTLLVLILVAAVCLGCGGEVDYDPKNAGPLEPELLEPDAPAVLEKWESSELLSKLPLYIGSGYYSDIIKTEDGGVNIYYYGTDAADFEAYCNSLKASGFRLMEGSSIWASEGEAGAPEFYKGSLKVTLVWLNDGMFAISCKTAG